MRVPSLFRDSAVPALTVVVAGTLAAAAVVRQLFDPDYFWHLATGRLILQTGVIPRTDPFSFTWFGRPWIPDQWLSDAAMAAIVDSLGPAVLLALFGLSAAVGVGLVAEAMRREGFRMLAIVPLVLLVSAAMLPQVTARPQVVSFALVGALMTILVRARPERHRLWLLPPLFLLWANVHGFFIVGLGVGAVYLGATLVGRTPMGPRPLPVLVAGVGSLAAAALTPSGPGGLLYAASFGDTGDWGARNIAEWQSPNFHDPQFLPFLALIVVMLVAGIRRSPGWMSFIALVGMAMGLVAIRTVGVSALLMLPATVASVSGALGRSRVSRPDLARRTLELSVALIGAAVLLAMTISRGPVQVDERSLPVAAVDVLMAADPDARVLAAYGWGGYVISEMYPDGGRVFVDGRMHKYAPDVIEHYDAIVTADPSWQAKLEQYGVDAILLKPDAVLVKGIAQAGGWCEAYRDTVQVLLRRSCP